MKSIEAQLFTERILSFHPAEVNFSFLTQYGIIDLISKGYQYLGTAEQIATYVKEEFSQELENPIVLCSLHPQDHQRIGALLILGRPTHPNASSSRFSAFWRNVITRDPEMSQCSDGQLRALEIAGVFIAKDNPNRGVDGDADRLLHAAIAHFAPQAIIGITSSPRAMRWRTRVVKRHGYLSWIGNTPISEDEWTSEQMEMAQLLVSSYVPIHGEIGAHGSVIVSSEYLEPQREADRVVPEDIPGAIGRSLMVQQSALATAETAAVVVLSMKQDLHNRIPAESYF